MSFANPLFLLGLVAAGIPLVLHILRSRNLPRVWFASLMFLRRVHRQKSFRLRITQILLLITRISLVTAVTLAFAQPFFESLSMAFLNPRPRVVAVVVDNSASMRATDGKTSLYARAAGEAVRVIRSLGPEDQLLVSTTSLVPRVVYQGPAGEYTQGIPAEPTWGGGADDWIQTLARIGERFAERSGSDKQIHLISDFTRKTWQERVVTALPAGCRVTLHPVRLDHHANWSIRGLTLDPPAITPDETARVQVRLTSQSTGPATSVTVDLLVDGKIHQSRSVGPGDGEVLPFQLDLDRPGEHQISVELPPDSLGLDDARSQVLEVLPHRRVILVNGRKRPTPGQDEVTFLERIFGSQGQPAPGFLATEVLDLDGLDDPIEADLLVIANLPQVSAPWGEKLVRWVDGGGTLTVFLGDQASAQGWNESFLNRLGGMAIEKTVDLRSMWEVTSARPDTMTSLFDGTYFRGVSSDSYHMLATGNLDGGQVPVRFHDGTPAICLLSVGRGHLAIFNASANAQTSNLPLFPIFPVLMAELSRLASMREVPVHLVGQRVVFELRSTEEPAVLTVQGPLGDLHSLKVERQDGGEGFVAPFEGTDRPGVYTLTRKTSGSSVSSRFVVAPPPGELDLETIPTDEIGGLIPGAELAGAQRERGVSGSGRGPNVLDLLLVAASLLLLTEGVLVWYLEGLAAGSLAPRAPWEPP